MNILRVTASMDPSMGGPPQGIRNSIGELERLGIRNEVVSCDDPEAAWLGRDSFPIHALGPGKYGFAYTPKLGPWLEENLSRFDAVIVHGLWLWPSTCAVRAIARHRRAVTRTEACVDGAPRRPNKWRVTSGRRIDGGSDPLPVTGNTRLFVMPHGMLDPWFQRDKSRRVKAVRNWFYWWLVERNVVNSADALLFTCEQELALARTTFGGYRPKREINVGYGIAEPPAFEPKMREAFAARCPGLHGRPYLLFMSRIHAKKNVAALVRAYARLASERAEPKSAVADVDGRRQTGGLNRSGAEMAEGKPEDGAELQVSGFMPQVLDFPDLVIAGPGWESDYGREVRGLIDAANSNFAQSSSTLDLKLKTSHSAPIHAVGMLSGAEKWGALYGCEAFVLPSHQENFGIAVVEALACGKPVLISNQVNIWREIVEDGAGLVEGDTEEGVEKLLRRFFERWRAETGDLRPEVKTKPRACYLQRFAIGPAAAQLAEALKG